MLNNEFFTTSYARLLTYYPVWYREVLEMDEILKTEGKLLDDADASLMLVLNNNYIDSANLSTIETLESFIGIPSNPSRTLEERRRLIKAYFVGFGKVSASMLKEMISSYTGAGSEIKFEPVDSSGNNCLYIYIDRGDEPTLYITEIDTLLRKKLPAHIMLEAKVRYTFTVVVGAKYSYNLHDYRLTGTYPQIALLGEAARFDLGAGQAAIGAVNDYMPCGIAYAGAGGE